MTLQVEAQEALCSAFYNMPFTEFLGEQETEHDFLAWFTFGERPKNMRVCVIRPKGKDEVRVKVEWRNYSADPRHPLKGEQNFTVSTYAATMAMLFGPVQAVAEKVLGIFHDVLSEEGVAGKIAELGNKPSE
jgi:hypothetical protein